jgi:hypothetical protein
MVITILLSMIILRAAETTLQKDRPPPLWNDLHWMATEANWVSWATRFKPWRDGELYFEKAEGCAFREVLHNVHKVWRILEMQLEGTTVTTVSIY